jgi:hypothetical protein
MVNGAVITGITLLKMHFTVIIVNRTSFRRTYTIVQSLEAICLNVIPTVDTFICLFNYSPHLSLRIEAGNRRWNNRHNGRGNRNSTELRLTGRRSVPLRRATALRIAITISQRMSMAIPFVVIAITHSVLPHFFARTAFWK